MKTQELHGFLSWLLARRRELFGEKEPQRD